MYLPKATVESTVTDAANLSMAYDGAVAAVLVGVLGVVVRVEIEPRIFML